MFSIAGKVFHPEPIQCLKPLCLLDATICHNYRKTVNHDDVCNCACGKVFVFVFEIHFFVFDPKSGRHNHTVHVYMYFLFEVID